MAAIGKKPFFTGRNVNRDGNKNALFALLSCVVVFAVHCRFDVCTGSYVESALLNGLNKLYGAFYPVNFGDLLVLGAVFMMLRTVAERDRAVDAGTGVLAFVFALLLVVCTSFMRYNSTEFMLANSFQFMLSAFCVMGFGILFYLVLRLIFHRMEKEPSPPSVSCEAQGTGTFFAGHFLVFGFFIIFAAWLFWILMDYPGTDCIDAKVQLEQFLGDGEWGSAHPPLSTAIMGILFTAGRGLVDANFGFFLYCLFQSCVGAWAFAYSMEKLRKLGISLKWCTAGVLFFALTPFWGTYAQWFEKDLLYAEVTVLQAVFMLEIINNRCCGKKDAICMTIFGILAALLRNNGIYAIAPALFLLIFWLKGAERRKMIAALAATVLIYEGITGGVYGLFGIPKPLAAEAFSIPFQQTARYVCEFGDEVTAYEREVIDRTLDYEAMANYDPVISDPIKVHYKGGDLKEYLKVWFQMFWKHPGCYVSAFINKGFGYLAPVSPNIEAWISLEVPGYWADLGVSHVFGRMPAEFLVQIWNLSMLLPIVKYLCMPGLYTWILLALAQLLLKHRKWGALILLVPSFVNVLVCLASPLAGAIRYELPTVAVMPMLIGWTYCCLHREKTVEP